MSILTYKSLFARSCRSWAEGESAPPSKRLKYQTDGAPTVYIAYVSEDMSMAGIAADALGSYGVDIYADWSAARLTDLDERAAERLRDRLSPADAWLVALISERARDTDRLLWVLELARETMARRQHAVLPVRYESPDWTLPIAFAAFPRIEARGEDIEIVWPDSPYHLPFRRWFRPPRRGLLLSAGVRLDHDDGQARSDSLTRIPDNPSAPALQGRFCPSGPRSG